MYFCKINYFKLILKFHLTTEKYQPIYSFEQDGINGKMVYYNKQILQVDKVKWWKTNVTKIPVTLSVYAVYCSIFHGSTDVMVYSQYTNILCAD